MSSAKAAIPAPAAQRSANRCGNGIAAATPHPRLRSTRSRLRIEPPPRVLLLGAGAESVALQEFVRRLGWRSLCVEHRGRWLGFAQRAGVDEIIEQPPQMAAAERGASAASMPPS